MQSTQPQTEKTSLPIPQEDTIAGLANSQRAMEQQVEAIRDYLIQRADYELSHRSDLHRRVIALEQVNRYTQSTVNMILGSRIWRTLQAGGGLMLRVLGWLPFGKAITRPATPAVAADRLQEIYLQCDSLPMEPKDPLCGEIEIRGWALSRDGIAKVELTIDGGPVIATEYGALRYDLPALFPGMANGLNSGYILNYDSEQLADGIHRVTITAFSKTGKSRTIEVPLLTSQTTGYASEYSRWLEAFEQLDPHLMALKLTRFAYLPVISILVPVFRTKLSILSETIESVRRQSYPHWELCLVDDGSDVEQITSLLGSFVALDSRIRVARQPRQSGISAASNRALEMATGEYVALLDHDDVLAPDALFHVVEALQASDRADVLYSDEDHMDEEGRRFAPFFKPDWSPDLILSENYVCHLMAFRRELAVLVGGFRTEFDLSQDHDILLRLSREANRVQHIPLVLYHWRTSVASMARASTSEVRAMDSSRGVVESYINENYPGARVEEGLFSGRWRVRYAIPEDASVSVLIPTAGKTSVLDRNLKALWKTAGATPFEVVVIDNSKGDNRKVADYVERWREQGHPIRYFDQRNEPFNYARLNNRAASTCTSPLLLFLNDDTEGISAGWLDAMAELACRPEVGAVGAKLLYPDGLIQHAGVTMGLAEVCGHSFKGALANQRHYYDFPDLIRNVSAVTAACVMIRGQVFQEMGGFEEIMFPIAYNDIDLTLRIGAAGYRVLYTPHAQLIHHEAFSKSERELHPHPAETLALKTRWRDVINRDPFYNPNLTRHKENWSLRWD